MITPEEMREIIAQLDFLASDHRYVAKWATERHGEGANDESGFVVLPHNPTIGTYKRRAECLERASAMLRSIAAERDKFDHAYVIDSRGVTHRKFTIIFDDGSQPKGAE